MKKMIIGSIVIALALTVSIGLAYTGTGNVVIENVENLVINVTETVEDFAGDVFGYVGSKFDSGIYIPNEGTLTVDGTTDLTSTTTIPRLDANSHTSLTWNTTTYGFDTADDPTVNAKVRNTGADLFCTDVILDISTALTSFGGSYRVGTTTATGDFSLTNTTTATLIASTAINSTTDNFLSPPNTAQAGSYFMEDNGFNTSSPWIWYNNDYVVVSMAGAGGATSSASISSAGAFAGVGTLTVNCRNRY